MSVRNVQIHPTLIKQTQVILIREEKFGYLILRTKNQFYFTSTKFGKFWPYSQNS